ncbi:MAG: hypothetical protein RL205_1734 [Actinomycetota bacterium]|jgi:hypothetical protein
MTSARLAKTKSVATSILLMVIAGFAPAVVMGAIGWKSAVSVAMLGGLATFMAATMGRGWQTGLVIAVPFSIMTALVIWASPYAWAAAILLAVAAFGRGYGAKVGLQNALMTVVIALGFFVSAPPTFETSFPGPLLAGLVMLGTTLWVTLVIFVARRWVHPPPLAPIDMTRVLWFSSVLAFMVGVSTWFIVDLKLGHAGGWIILTIIVVYQPNLGDGFKKAGERAFGTVIGFVIAVIVGLFVENGPLLYLLGTICLVIAMVVMGTGKPYWIFAAFLTPAIVLYESAGSTVTKVAMERLEATLIGVAIVLVVMLLLLPLANRARNKQPAQV